MRPSTPRRYRLHSAACAPDAPAAVADGSKVTPRGCTVDLATSKQERKASQPVLLSNTSIGATAEDMQDWHNSGVSRQES
jgi:hypothetical protein